MKISAKYMGLLLLGALTACQKSEVPTTPEIGREPIVFNSFLKEGNSVTPMSKAIGGDLNQGYHLGGAWTDGPFLTSERRHFYAYLGVGVPGTTDIEMRVDGTPKDPDAAQLYWNTDGKTYHTFYAYTANPAETPAGCGITEVRKFDSPGNPQGACLLFKQPDDPMKQIDLLTADNSNIIVSPGTTSAVNLYFQHRLSKVSINVFGTGGANLTNCQAKVTYNGATAPYSGVGNPAWAGVFVVKDASGAYEESSDGRLNRSSRHTGTYNLGHQFTVSNTQASEFDAISAGSMILIPQPLNTDGWATITLEYSVDGSSSRNTAKLDLPKLGKLLATKEYAIALNLIERSSILTIASVRLVDWNSQNETIDNLPGEYSLSLSTTQPTESAIPAAGKEYTITVNSSRGWTLGKNQNVTVNPSSGKKGVTSVKITVAPNPTREDRSAFAVFNTVGAVESMASSTWMGTQLTIPYVEANGIYWSTGYLVADGPNGCRIGSANDDGLYFQTGSLIGWKGGVNGDGVGRKLQVVNTFYGGATTFVAKDEVAVYPSTFTRLNNITKWPDATSSMLYYFNDATWATANEGKTLSQYTNFANLAANGIGDPCTYYLKGKWRIPTLSETWNLTKSPSRLKRLGTDGTITAIAEVSVGGTEPVIYFACSDHRNAADGTFYSLYGSSSRLSSQTISSGVIYWNTLSTSVGSGYRQFRMAAPARCVMNK